MPLSTEAKAMLLGAFLNPKAALRYANGSSIKSPQARKGLAELGAAGLASVSTNGVDEIWQMTEAGMAYDRRSIARDPLAWMRAHGSFPLEVRRDAATDADMPAP
ncbi:hypothetical protein [Defluviimonas salinarum]|uniref:Uncharacterized protein n=1 Tax=Defluviimonas salinarum TaxID=2992147 RepID=A0ABT3J9Q0_9RHOB|nr:hypothetical protein [Defluviimonas salinarum]MCW3784424.1 hypothetical protein [Defluviimonas salinarum]